MLEFKNVSFAYEKDRPVLKDISFTIAEGEAVGLIGSNGAGKSTLLKALAGLITCRGEIKAAGLPMCRENLPEIRRRLGFVLQDCDDQLFMPTVLEDMMFAPLNYGFSKEDAETKADAALKRLELTELKHRHNHKLSGGEKRMAAIATILAMEPRALIVDEPTIALDPQNRRAVINTLNSIECTRLIASHDLDMILDTCDRVILLFDGKIAADGKTADILNDKELLESHRMELPLGIAALRKERLCD